MNNLTPDYIIRKFAHGWILCGIGLSDVHKSNWEAEVGSPRIGGLPMTALNECIALFPKGCVMDAGIANHYKQFCNIDAVIVIGRPSNLAVWRRQIEAALAGRSPEDRWWYGTDTGMSSSAIFAILSKQPNHSAAAHKYRTEATTPRDADDFGRCRRLIDSIPEWKSRLDEVAKAYPQTKWPAIIARWDELVAATEDEQTRILRSINEGT